MSRFMLSRFRESTWHLVCSSGLACERQADLLYPCAAHVAAHILIEPCRDVRHRLRVSQQQVPELLNDCPVWGQVYFNKIFLHLWV